MVNDDSEIEIADYEDDIPGASPSSDDLIPPEQLMSDFGLSLQAGRVDSAGKFTKLNDNQKLVVGSTVSFVLQKETEINNFRLV